MIATVWVELTTFQLASTAFTVTVNGTPAVWAVGVPVLPVSVRGAATSPGTSTWSLVNVPARTVNGALVPDASGDMPLVRVAVRLTPVSALE